MSKKSRRDVDRENMDVSLPQMHMKQQQINAKSADERTNNEHTPWQHVRVTERMNPSYLPQWVATGGGEQRRLTLENTESIIANISLSMGNEK